MDYERLKIKSHKYWDVYLHENQCYLGRMFILLREDAGVEDFMSIRGALRDEFFHVGEELKTALKALFKPDRMNYTALSNNSPSIHVHFVPRYEEPRIFAGILFEDTRWGKNYAPYDQSFALEESILFDIRDAVATQLEKEPSDYDNVLRTQRCHTPQEIASVMRFRQEHFFDKRGIKDPYVWTLNHKDHDHFALYKGKEMIGYAHVQHWPRHRAALRIIVIDEKHQGKGYGAYLMKSCEQALRESGIKALQTEAHHTAVKFYKRLGYREMPFDDPEGLPSDENDTPMGKHL